MKEKRKASHFKGSLKNIMNASWNWKEMMNPFKKERKFLTFFHASKQNASSSASSHSHSRSKSTKKLPRGSKLIALSIKPIVKPNQPVIGVINKSGCDNHQGRGGQGGRNAHGQGRGRDSPNHGGQGGRAVRGCGRDRSNFSRGNIHTRYYNAY
jgi:hypothetical protein